MSRPIRQRKRPHPVPTSSMVNEDLLHQVDMEAELAISTPPRSKELSNTVSMSLNWFRGQKFVHLTHKTDRRRSISLRYPKDIEKILSPSVQKIFQELEAEHLNAPDNDDDDEDEVKSDDSEVIPLEHSKVKK